MSTGHSYISWQRVGFALGECAPPSGLHDILVGGAISQSPLRQVGVTPYPESLDTDQRKTGNPWEVPFSDRSPQDTVLLWFPRLGMAGGYEQDAMSHDTQGS